LNQNLTESELNPNMTSLVNLDKEEQMKRGNTLMSSAIKERSRSRSQVIDEHQGEGILNLDVRAVC
jgi:hypothetical protein